MIYIKSLRIGSYFHYDEKIFVLKKIEGDFVSGDRGRGNVKFNIGSIKPIPLTEQILLNLGFEKQELYLNLSCGSFDLSIDEGNLLLIDSYLGDYIVIGVFNFLHQIQNIVYDLSGKELEFKK